jgi:hypothetical protein
MFIQKLLGIVLLLYNYPTYGQYDNYFKDSLVKEQMDLIIIKDFYKDSTLPVKAVFVCKIDSLGEVHSAHLRWDNNLQLKSHYIICIKIESKINLKYIYNKYKRDFIGEKYVVCTYPYSSNRDKEQGVPPQKPTD